MIGHRNISDSHSFQARTSDTAQRLQDQGITKMVSTCSACTSANREVAAKMPKPFDAQTLPVFIADALDTDWREKIKECVSTK